MQRIEVAGARIAFGDAGTGAPVLALHGAGSSGAMWRSLVDYLAGRFRILTPDLPGYGDSGMPEVSGPLGPELAAVAALAAHAGRPVTSSATASAAWSRSRRRGGCPSWCAA